MKADIESALSANQDKLLKKKNVVGVALGKRIKHRKETDEDVVVVFVNLKEPLDGLATRDIIPRELGGVKTDVVETGEFFAIQTPPADRQKKFRPAPPGVSIGHYRITAGTFGCVVKDNADTRLILSNNHVLANSNNGRLGDPILQPGRVDGGSTISDTIARLHRFVHINFPDEGSTCPVARGIGGFFNFWYWAFRRKTRFRIVVPEAATDPNYVDAALGLPEDSDIVDEIIDIGKPVGTMAATIGMVVKKSGRTTGTQTGSVQYTSATVRVNYGGDRIATFTDQIVITPGTFSAGGDSGSAIITMVNGNAYLIGLLFAGSGSYTIGNRIENVFRLLEVSL